MKNFISPSERNKPIVTANGVEIHPRDLKAGKFTKSKRIAPEIGQRRKAK